ncbi:MAG: thioesterase domain-containing protein [Gammaproteobacteria bacterium]|nr:thioesterase domain-containing protein [Gammaproteobacteria bacterium]
MNGRKWFRVNAPENGASIRLFCFPYAGGSEHVFASWSKQLPKEIAVCPLLLPGRGARIREKPGVKLSFLLSELSIAIKEYSDLPFAFFGHSMGAMLSYELSVRIREDHGLVPEHLFVSGRGAPQCERPPTSRRPKSMAALSDSEFIKELKKFEGTPEQIFSDKELLNLFLPILRSDFELADRYEYQQKEPLNCPITAFGGRGELDEVSIENLRGWSDRTCVQFDKFLFEGGHFFIKSAERRILETIAHKCRNAFSRGAGTLYRASSVYSI